MCKAEEIFDPDFLRILFAHHTEVSPWVFQEKRKRSPSFRRSITVRMFNRLLLFSFSYHSFLFSFNPFRRSLQKIFDVGEFLALPLSIEVCGRKW
jgi:hypothetical protein